MFRFALTHCMTKMLESDVGYYLKLGIKSLSEGNSSEAIDHFNVALNILKAKTKTNNPIENERLKRQISSLELAIQNLQKSNNKNESPDNVSKSMKVLSELGLSVDEGKGPSMSDVAGMKTVKEALYLQIIYPLKFPELADEFNVKMSGGILLYGPPGNGKTFLIKALAREANLKFIYVNPSSLFSQWFGNFEKNISALFDAARKLSPCILFFDELDSLFPPRDNSSSEAARRGVSQFLNEIGGFSSGSNSSQVVLLGATNVPWNLDPAVTRPGRFDRMIYIPPPDTEARKEMIRMYAGKIKRVNNIDIDKLGEKTSGYSAADIEYLFRYASQRAFLNAIESKDSRPIDTEYLLEAMETVRPSIGKKLVERYEVYSKDRDN